MEVKEEENITTNNTEENNIIETTSENDTVETTSIENKETKINKEFSRQRFARHLIAVQRCDECFRNVGHNDLGVVQCGLRQPVRVHAHAERQPRIRCCDFERLRQRFGIVCADQHSRNANALQYTDSRPHIRAVRQMAFIVLHMQLRNYCSAAQIAQS